MMRVSRRLFLELKSLGGRLILFSVLCCTALIAVVVFGGELLDAGIICFEVASPLLVAIAVGEWGQVKADGSRDIIAAQGKSLFSWVVIRFAVIFLTVGTFIFAGMILACLVRTELSLLEVFAFFFPPAFLFATACLLFSCLFEQEHVGTLLCCVVWVAALLSAGLLHVPVLEFFYPFIGFAGGQYDAFLINKAALFAMGLITWTGIFLACVKRAPVLES